MTDIEAGAALCKSCGQLLKIDGSKDEASFCPICGSAVRTRKKNSLQRTWALTITALCTYLPANFLPVMDIDTISGKSSNTIIGGVIELWANEMYFIAGVVFCASFIVPLFKLICLFYLLITMRTKDSLSTKKKTNLYHMVEIIGKWSMLDIYVITIMAGLVNMGYIIQIKGGIGAIFFASTVIITMLASRSFDSRLIWDKQGDS